MSYVSVPASNDNWADLWDAVETANTWLDDNPAQYGDPLMWRLGKIAEEYGEVMQSLIAHGGQNPRKPQGPMDDVVRELCDVILTASVALRCATGTDAKDVFSKHVESVLRRIKAVEVVR